MLPPVRDPTHLCSQFARALRRIAATLGPKVQIQLTFLDERMLEEIARLITSPRQCRTGHAIAQTVTRTIKDADYAGIDKLFDTFRDGSKEEDEQMKVNERTPRFAVT